MRGVAEAIETQGSAMLVGVTLTFDQNDGNDCKLGLRSTTRGIDTDKHLTDIGGGGKVVLGLEKGIGGALGKGARRQCLNLFVQNLSPEVVLVLLHETGDLSRLPLIRPLHFHTMFALQITARPARIAQSLEHPGLENALIGVEKPCVHHHVHR